MNFWSRLSGLIGLILLAFGLFGAFVFRRFDDAYTVSHTLVGGVLVFYWFLSVGLKQSKESTQIVSGRTVRFGVSAILYTVVFVGILAAINWIAQGSNKRWDLTEEGVYSLSEQSSQVIDSLKKPLKIVLFDVPQEGDGRDPKELVALYKDRNTAKVSTEIVNPRAKPQLVEKYGMQGDNLIYIEYGEGESKGVSRLSQITEDVITNAIIKLTRGDSKKIYLLQGHGESGLDDPSESGLKAFADSASNEHLAVEGIVLSTKQEVPQDAAAIIVAGQKSPFLPGESDLIASYVEKGGKLLVLADPRQGEDSKALAARFGFQIGNNVVIDLVQRLLMGPTLATEFLTNNFGSHDITKKLSKRDVVIMNLASSVVGSSTPQEGVTYTTLLSSSSDGWGETNMSALLDAAEPTAQQDADDVKGPVSLASAYEKVVTPASETNEDKPSFKQLSRVVVFGDSDWITNKYFQYSSHKDLIMNTLNWLVGEEGGVTIRPKKMKASLAPIGGETFRSLLLTGFLIPELLVLFGVFVWWRRRTLAV
mgnify:CR=1 FL=1